MSKTLPFKRVLSTLWTMLSRRQRAVFISLVGALMVAGVLELGTILLILGFVQGLRIDPATGERSGKLMMVLNQVIPARLTDVEYAVFIGGGLLIALVTRSAIGTLAHFMLNRFLMKLNQRVSVNLFRGYLVAPYEKFNVEGAEKASGAISRIFQEFSKSFAATSQVISDGLTVMMVVVLLIFLDPWFTALAAVIFTAAGYFSYSRMANLYRKLGRKESRATKAADRYLRDGLEGIVETRLRDARRVMIEGYSEALNQLALYKRRGSAVKRLPKSVNEIALVTFLIGAMLRFALVGESVTEALATLAVFAFAGMKMSGFLTRINKSLQILKRQDQSFAQHADKLRELAPALIRGADSERSNHYLASERPLRKGQSGKLREAITVSGVSYRYPGADTDALSHVSLSIRRGEFVGICGGSGGGKSTLALLLLGLLEPSEGEILCDDWPLSEHIRRWHENVGYVGQDMYFSKGTIRENIAFAVPERDIDDERVERALRMASADGFVSQLSLGTYTRMRGGGRNFSMGQRQRLIIARALYLDPQVIIFDEATASVDNITEREIADSIASLSGQKTVIAIAHRLTTLKNCDNLYLINGGRVEASGSYERMLEESEAFRRLALASQQEHEAQREPVSSSVS